MRRQGMRPYYWESTTDTSMEPTSQFKVGWASGGKREKKVKERYGHTLVVTIPC